LNSNLNIIKVLAHGNTPSIILSSTAFALILFFYIFTVGSYFHVSVSHLVNRVNYHEPFSAYIVNEFVDHLIIAYGTVAWLGFSLRKKARIVSAAIYGIITSIAALVGSQAIFDAVTLSSIPIVASFLIFNRLISRKILQTSYLSLTYLAIFGTAIGCAGLIISSEPLFSVTDKSIQIRDYTYELLLLISNLSPILVLFLVICSPFKLFIKKFSTIQNKNFTEPINNGSIRTQTKILYLLIFMVLSVIIALIPHLATINQDNQQVGSDSVAYTVMINTLTNSHGPQDFIQKAFSISTSRDRVLSSLFLYAIVKITPASVSYTVDHLPIILGPGLVLAVFFLTRELTANDTTSLLASFLTTVSFHTLIGIYSGIYANWFALIIGFFSLVFLLRFLKAANKLNLIVYSILLIFLVFTHVYTWTILALFSGIFLVIMYKMNSYRKKSIVTLLIVVLSSVAIDFARSTLTGFSEGIEGNIGLVHVAGTEQVTSLWSNLTDTTQNYAGGLFGNFIIFALGIYWLFRSNSRKLSSIFILIFLAIAILPLLFGNGIIQSRMLYDIPFQIPAAIGLTYLKRHPNGLLLILPICIWLLDISVRAVSSFYFVAPT